MTVPSNGNNNAAVTECEIGGVTYNVIRLSFGDDDLLRLPRSLQILAENVARCTPGMLGAFASWLRGRGRTQAEIEFHPSRLLMHDTTCVPALVDIAALRDAVRLIGGDASVVNPQIPVDLVIDHSVMVDRAGSADAFVFNLDRDFERNAERYSFIRWAQKSFTNFRVVPPATGILHQVNLEHLSEVVRVLPQPDGPSILIPDTLVGTDSHTPMVNALGVLAWGVGGIEAEAAALGQPITLRIPEVVGIRLTNRLPPGVTAIDLALTLTELLRRKNVIEKIVEFYGQGVANLTIADRATVSNMAPEYGATCSFFPIDERTLEYLRLIGKTEAHVALVEGYARAQRLWYDADIPLFTETIAFDLSSVEPSLSGPRRPQERVSLSQAPASFLSLLREQPSIVEEPRTIDNKIGGYAVQDGAVLIASITSCTNTSNPALMVGAGLLARNARRRGLVVPPWVKTSLSPGSHVVSDYLQASGLQQPLDELGFQLVGYGCMTCIGNSGSIQDELAQAVCENRLVGAAVLSGNRNFEDRVNASVRASYLGSPALVVAYALAGSILKDLNVDPVGHAPDGSPVFLRDLWPSDDEIEQVVSRFVTSEIFHKHASDVFKGPDKWQTIAGAQSVNYPWRETSTYLRRPIYFNEISETAAASADIHNAKLLLMLGDSITTDHISPAGAIPERSLAAKYLKDRGVLPADFNQYSTRRGNHEVMLRGLFSNPRLKNELQPEDENIPVYETALRYQEQRTPLIVIAGQDYGGGSSRDWAAKGPALLGVRAVIAESFERIHRSNLVGMGVLPLQFIKGMTRKDLTLDGSETFDLLGLMEGMSLSSRSVSLRIHRSNGAVEDVQLILRAETAKEVDYLRHGGLLPYVFRQLVTQRSSETLASI
jgi:aconitate hydratase